MRANPDQQANILYKIVMPAAADANIVKKVTGIAHARVRFEQMKKSDIVQCKNCQRFGHSTRMCHYKYRCVKCNADHATGHCPRNTNLNIPVSCVNCNGNHSANNLNECRVARKMIEKRNQIKSKSTGDNSAGNHTNLTNNHSNINLIKQANNNINSDLGNINRENRTWARIARGASGSNLDVNVNVNNLSGLIQSIVTECITKLCSL